MTNHFFWLQINTILLTILFVSMFPKIIQETGVFLILEFSEKHDKTDMEKNQWNSNSSKENQKKQQKN